MSTAECVIEAISSLSQGLDLLVTLEAEVFEKPLSRDRLERKLRSANRLQILIARVDNVVCGYKVGYEHDSDYFYSWIGGVSPKYRRSGIASKLMVEQHRIAKEQGFSYVQTKTKNKYREMLILNLKHGFEIRGVYAKMNEEALGIVLEKKL